MEYQRLRVTAGNKQQPTVMLLKYRGRMLALREITMIDVSFEIKGEKVQPDNMKDVLDILFLKHIRKKINNSIDSIRCNEHGKQASVLVKGQNIDNLNYEVSGCCEDLIKKVKKKIK
jgi:hypothetical protein